MGSILSQDFTSYMINKLDLKCQENLLFSNGFSFFLFIPWQNWTISLNSRVLQSYLINRFSSLSLVLFNWNVARIDRCSVAVQHICFKVIVETYRKVTSLPLKKMVSDKRHLHINCQHILFQDTLRETFQYFFKFQISFAIFNNIKLNCLKLSSFEN